MRRNALTYVKDGPDMKKPNPYAGSALDRAAQLRDDEGALKHHRDSAQAVFLPVWRAQNLVDSAEQAGPAMVGLDNEMWETFVGARRDSTPDQTAYDHIFLGLRGGLAYFTADVSDIEAPDDHPSLGAQASFQDLRKIGPMMAPDDASLLAYARGIVYWHSRHRYCGVCGATTAVRSAGHRRQCTNTACATEQFPRTDPAVIMLVHDGDRIIVARSPRFLTGMHSVLAGFLEPGECLEDTVAREVMEEVGVEVTDIEYQSSQPWPFPASLMVGFRARALTFDLNPDPAELENAHWMTRAELLASPEDDNFRLPRKDSIASRLIQAWLQEES